MLPLQCTLRGARRSEWLAAARACSYATFFHTPIWAELFSRYTRGLWRPAARVASFEDGREAVIVGSEQQRLRGAMTLRNSAVAGGYGGWISEQSLEEAHGRTLCGLLTDRGAYEWRENPFDPLMPHLDPASARDGFCQAIDLGGDDDLLDRGSRAHRKAVARARRDGVNVRCGAGLEDYRAYYEVYRISIRRWRERNIARSECYDKTLFEDIARNLQEHARLWLAEIDGAIAAGVVCFYWNRHAVAWHGASDQSYYASRPGNLLYLSMARDARDRGFAWFDLNPSGSYGGVEKFKEHCGAQPIRSRVFSRLTPAWKAARFLTRARRRMRNLS